MFVGHVSKFFKKSVLADHLDMIFILLIFGQYPFQGLSGTLKIGDFFGAKNGEFSGSKITPRLELKVEEFNKIPPVFVSEKNHTSRGTKIGWMS